MFPSFSHILLVLVVVLILFGAGKLPRVMGDLGKGIRNLKEGLQGEEGEPARMETHDDSEVLQITQTKKPRKSGGGKKSTAKSKTSKKQV